MLFYSLDMTLTDLMHLHIDNRGALELIKSGQINDRTKHIETNLGISVTVKRLEIFLGYIWLQRIKWLTS